jgi:hypothetical protein
MRQHEVRNLARPQAQTGEKQDDRLVAVPILPVTRGKYSVDAGSVEMARRRRQLPIREARNGMVQPLSALASGD